MEFRLGGVDCSEGMGPLLLAVQGPMPEFQHRLPSSINSNASRVPEVDPIFRFPRVPGLPGRLLDDPARGLARIHAERGVGDAAHVVPHGGVPKVPLSSVPSIIVLVAPVLVNRSLTFFFSGELFYKLSGRVRKTEACAP